MVANADAMSLDYSRVIRADEADEITEPRRGLSRQEMIGLALIAGGLVALLVTWLQIKDVQNIAAQIPYVTSGGLLGVALAVIGAVALFTATRSATAETATAGELQAQVQDLAIQVKWMGDAVEQIA